MAGGWPGRESGRPARPRRQERRHGQGYDQTLEFAIPPGHHRVTLDNIGGDWACIGWYDFKGETLDP